MQHRAGAGILQPLCLPTLSGFKMLGIIDGEPIGFFSVEPMGRGRAAHNASFGIAIVRSCWHLGIGAIFMAIATDFAKTAGYHKICLDVRGG